jgi:butyryl-CoA dehydrogenase
MHFDLSEEQLMFQMSLRDFVDREVVPQAAEWEEAGTFPWDTWHRLADLGICAMTLPPQYSAGAGGSKLLFALAVEEIARGSAGLATSYLVSSGIAMENIVKYGTESQKRELLTRCSGGEIAFFALTEPLGGSDLRSMETRYVRQTDCFVIDGTKTFITNGEESSFGLVYARDRSASDYRGISCFVVEKDNPGFSVGKRERKTGQHCSSTTELVFDNCRVPLAALVGREGKGLRMALEAIDASRVSIGAQALGIARAAYDAAVDYAGQRKAFGKSIGQFQAVQWMLSDMATEIEAARLLVYKAAWLIDRGRPFARAAAIAKLYASEACRRVCQAAVQIFGGYGYTRDFPVERYARDQRVTEIYEGTSEMQRLAIARDIFGLR